MEDNQLTIPGTDVPEDKMTTLLRLSRELEERHIRIGQLQNQLDEETDKGKQIEEVLIPQMMNELGLKQLTLASGRVISLVREVYGSISREKQEAAIAWLENNGHGGIVKKEALVPGEAAARLAELGLPYQLKVSVHPSTLRAFLREKVIETPDPTLPRDAFSVFEQERAVVKEPRR